MRLQSIVLVVVIILYFANYYVLSWVYPEALSDYDVFLKFYATRNTLYEAMFFLLFAVNYLGTDKRLVKALSCFGMCIAFGSFVDKGFFEFTGYVLSDVALLVVSGWMSIRIYRKWKK